MTEGRLAVLGAIAACEGVRRLSTVANEWLDGTIPSVKGDANMADINDVMADVQDGMDVYGSDGDKLGSVGDVNIGTRPGMAATSESTTEERSYFQIRRGFLGLGNDLWMPADAVEKVSDDGVVLRYTKDEAERRAWGTEPTTPQPGDDDSPGLLDLDTNRGDTER